MRDLGLEYKFIHKNEDDEVLYNSGWLKNDMTDDGLEEMYDVYFRGESAPDSPFEIGLNNDSLSQTSSFEDLTEVTGTGYSRPIIERNTTGFPTLALDNTDMQVTTKTVTFENTGSSAWTEAVDGFLLSNDSGNGYRLISFKALSAPRTLQPGDTLDVTINIKGTQPA